ncbi:dynamin family protein [Thecamonas trahens ATCC 50062]|uniref:Dynamin family protein n=1 Tax=Thecamonas trahens ATCC 50062 TaxID=461836 RepID=A0A0L0D4A7_THETB|nr:dynamin family protein [Thecamonas trahens ATCC 50062]KNC47149.1 dynamin family protein [Thecamonas trahens ATCC 50062]|eukprot:XP_013759923.1 dynamin family protein [Thecamonas trahens ATCC 50062]
MLRLRVHGLARWGACRKTAAFSLGWARCGQRAATLDALDTNVALSQEQEAVLVKEEQALAELGDVVAVLDGPKDDRELIDAAVAALRSPFLAVVVGEFNAGKSTFVNALLGGKHAAMGVTPTTAEVTVIHYGGSEENAPSAAVHAAAAGSVKRLPLPIPWLRHVNLVDTPGTNAVIREHERITQHFVPRADLVLFLTSAYSPFSASEREFLASIADHGKKTMIVLNKADVVTDPTERATVADFVTRNAAEVLGGAAPRVQFVSARGALKAKLAGTPLDGTGFDDLEAFIVSQLSSDARIRLKLASPLGTASHLARKYSQVVDARLALLAGDYTALQAVDAELAKTQAGMQASLKAQLDRIDSVLYRLAERGDEFFDEQLTLTNFRALFSAAELKASFERDVVKDLSYQMEEHVNEFIDWFVERNNDQWARVHRILTTATQNSPQADDDDADLADARNVLVQQLGAVDVSRRSQLLDHIGSQAASVVTSFDKKAEAAKLADSLRSAMVSALGTTGALGLSTALVVAMTDITGTLLLGVLAASGLYILPYRKRQLRAELHERIEELRVKLNDSLEATFRNELHATDGEIRAALAPYAKFPQRASTL